MTAMAEQSQITSHDELVVAVELRLLLENLRKSIKFWFLSGEKRSLDVLQSSCVDILKHGLKIEGNKWLKQDLDSSNLLPIGEAVRKFSEELEWLQRSMMIRDVDVCKHTDNSASGNSKACEANLHDFLNDWTGRNLQAKTMCTSIQAMVTERDFLQTYYNNSAFLRKDSYVTAFGICLTAYELNQCSLLCQIDDSLFTDDCVDGPQRNTKQHKRTSSHPNFTLPVLKTVSMTVDPYRKKELTRKTSKRKAMLVFRRVKSLPAIASIFLSDNNSILRPRSKTLNVKTRPPPKPNLSTHQQRKAELLPIPIKSKINTKDKKCVPNEQASSLQSCTSEVSNSTLDSNSSVQTIASSSPSSSLSTSMETKNQRRIELINCDNIKIWTDQSVTHETTPSSSKSSKSLDKHYMPPSPVLIKMPKSISPMNSLLSTLFGTPPTYSTWFTSAAVAADTTDPAIADAALDADHISELNESAEGCGKTSGYTYNTSNSVCGSGGASGVFNVFSPVYGQKLQQKHKAHLFEEGVSTLDYKKKDVASAGKATAAANNKAEMPCSSSKRTNPSSQSLTVFLQNAQLSRNINELEKENAHFRVSEAIISAIEHIKWSKSQPTAQRKSSAVIVATDWLENEQKHANVAGDGCAVSAHGDGFKSEELLVDDSNDLPYAELGNEEPFHFETMSAEVVGLSLLSKFNDQQLPKVSELKWLVSDEDTPQQLLPMPDNSQTSNPDDNIFPSTTRGTRYWAPPRPQIIFTDHPIPNRKEIIRKQNNRCAGCGMRVAKQNMSSFRYCTYFGKYHCTGCHRNQMSATPAKILQNWDFKCYPVSVFAYRLLDEMYTFPLFHVPDLNPALYIKSKQLLEARNKRIKLKYIKDFIKTCRFATREQTYFATIPDYIPNDPDTWSMSDFVDAHNQSIQRSIDELIEKCENHIFHCVLCTGRGFYCEFCLASYVIFPWSKKVFRCDRCGSCFHLNCWKSMLEICCRCHRIRNRQTEIAEAFFSGE